MICGKCEKPTVTWRGQIANLTHTECSTCGAVNSQRVEDEAQYGTEEGDVCKRSGCLGVIELLPNTSEDGGCSCHISPPCAFCVSTMPECSECGWREEP